VPSFVNGAHATEAKQRDNMVFVRKNGVDERVGFLIAYAGNALIVRVTTLCTILG
jgi:hypothetical protein